MQGQRVILLALFITVTYATKINFFEAQVNIPLVVNQSTINADQIQLWVDVTECPSVPCSCQVQVNISGDNSFNVEFLTNKPSTGNVDIKNLQPDTLYSFTLSCEGTDETQTRNIRTDYGQPSPPPNVTVVLNSKRLHISWLRPLIPAGPINNYRLYINSGIIKDDLPNDKMFYDMTEDYVYGTQYTFALVACNKNNRNEKVCSKPNESTVNFHIPTVATTTTTIKTPISEANTNSNLSNFFLILSLVQFVLFR